MHEVKQDGYRTQLILQNGEVRAFTRKGHNWTDRYSIITEAAAGLPCRVAILDGEVVVQDGRGASDFEALQEALSTGRGRLIYYAFDLLHLDGEDVRDQPLSERRRRLSQVLSADETSPVQFSQEFIGEAAAFFRACADHGLEGIVSKRASSRYRSGRSKAWLKTKCFTESELMLVGIDRDRKTGAERALLANQSSGRRQAQPDPQRALKADLGWLTVRSCRGCWGGPQA
ncbi:MAG: ATP-dependent DNA ligase [Methyloceanibacter sp.]|uniref:ATP-dependent DNA ligase n=1 Tax=Methyloceanibacter sp. TaxID=1965321 RepID=UPI003EE170DB